MIGTFGLNTCVDVTLSITRCLDFYIIDREHGRASLTEAASLLSSISDGCERFIRVSSCERVEIQKVLELHPDGILIPQIGSLQEACNAVDWSFFPPAGSRGVSPYTRGFDFIHHDLESKKQRLNDELKLGLLIEGQSGFDALDDIIEKLGSKLHLLYFGLFDFANSKRVSASWSNPDIYAALEIMVKKAKSADIAIGTIARNKDEIALLEQAGVTYVVYLNDLGIISEAINSV